MALLHDKSDVCCKSELDLFTVPHTQMSIVKGPWVEYHPVSSITDEGPIEFNVSGTSEEYLDLSQTMLQVTVKVTNNDNTALPADAPVGPVNLFLPSLFAQVDIMLNEKLVSQPSNTYPYRAYIESLLHYGGETKESQLTQQLYYKDKAGKMDVVNPLASSAEANPGLAKRHGFIVESKLLSLLGPIYADIFFQERLLLPGVDLKIKLNRSKDAFCLLSSTENARYKIKIESAALYVRRVKTSPTIMLNHARALEKTTAKYPVNKVDVKSFSIPAGSMSINKDNLFHGQLPNRVVVGFVDTDAFNGTFGYIESLLHYGGETKESQLTQQLYYKDKAGKMDVVNPLASSAEANPGLAKRHGFIVENKGININREEYCEGYTLFAFDLTSDLSDGCHLNLIKQGNLRLELQFDVAIPNTVNCIVYSEGQGLIQIDKSRNIIYDYQ
ncbi:uncharacterized protein F54H12.2-like [Diadema antillarum]|uniref:uncharacterized protein F54H12.2-like n=1 Tax=Diadema antillarum TaxID=105358 RepID=UPI003A8A66E8